MSIHNFIDKIKSKTGIDKLTFVYLFIIVGVGVGSFGLGRISINNKLRSNQPILLPNYQDNLKNIPTENVSATAENATILKEKRYVASKNGKMYYSLDCSGAKRIKPENQVWFNSESDAIKSGYTKSVTCK